MLRYLVRRLVLTIPVLIGVATLVFALIHFIPGDPAAAMLGEGATQEEVDQLRERLGLNRPLLVQYVSFLNGVVRGDLGDPRALAEAARGQDVVHHVAALVGALTEAEFVAANRDGTANVVRAAEAAGVARFVLCSSMAAGGHRAAEDEARDAGRLGRTHDVGGAVAIGGDELRLGERADQRRDVVDDVLSARGLGERPRVAEIAPHDTVEKRHVLHQQRPVEPEPLAQLIHLFLRGALPQHGGGRVARDEMNEREDERRHADEHRNGEHEPANEVPKHRDGAGASVLRGLDG